MLKDVRPDAELIPTGHQTLEEILPLMRDRVRADRSVVRLHSGDLSLYSAIQEQIQGLARLWQAHQRVYLFTGSRQ